MPAKRQNILHYGYETTKTNQPNVTVPGSLHSKNVKTPYKTLND